MSQDITKRSLCLNIRSKKMKIDPHYDCQRQDIVAHCICYFQRCIDYVDIAVRSSTRGLYNQNTVDEITISTCRPIYVKIYRER